MVFLHACRSWPCSGLGRRAFMSGTVVNRRFRGHLRPHAAGEVGRPAAGAVPPQLLQGVTLIKALEPVDILSQGCLLMAHLCTTVITRSECQVLQRLACSAAGR
jgi:hypothetical protein